MFGDVIHLLTVGIVIIIYVCKSDGFFWSSVPCGELSVQDPVYVDLPVTLEFKPKAYSNNSTIQWYMATGGIFGESWKPVSNSPTYIMYNAEDGSAFYMEIAGNNVTTLKNVYVTFYTDGTTEPCDSDTVRFRRQYLSSTPNVITTNMETTPKANSTRIYSNTHGSTGTHEEAIPNNDDDYGKIDTTTFYEKTRSYTDTGFHRDETQPKIYDIERGLDTSPTIAVTEIDRVTNSHLNMRTSIEVFPDNMKQGDEVSAGDNHTFNYQWVIVGGVCILVITIVVVLVIKWRRNGKIFQWSAVRCVTFGKHDDDVERDNESIHGPSRISVDSGLDGVSRRPVASSCLPEVAPDQLSNVDLTMQPLTSTTVSR